MAHRSNVTPVTGSVPSEDAEQKVVDPVCGRAIDRRASRHMLFRPDATYYFCSKECQEKFIHPVRGSGKALKKSA